MQTDEQLVEALRSGSQEAMEILVHRHHAALFAYASRLVRDYGVAQDLVQEAFYRLCRDGDALERPQALKSWLYRVVTRLAADWGKSAAVRREVPSGDPGGVVPGGGGPGRGGRVVSITEALEQKEDRRMVLDALQAIGEEQRVVIFLRFYQDLSLEEIGEVLELPVGTVKSRLHYGLKALHRLLAAQFGTGTGGKELGRQGS